MYYIVESEALGKRLMFRDYQDACLAAFEIALHTPYEVRVVRLATPGGLGSQIICVYNCEYGVSAAPPPIQVEEDAEGSERRYRRKRNK